MMDDDDVIPTLLAYRHRDRFKAFCTFCDAWHHWYRTGLQPGRCPQYTPNAAQVVLVDAGRWASPKVVKYGKHRL